MRRKYAPAKGTRTNFVVKQNENDNGGALFQRVGIEERYDYDADDESHSRQEKRRRTANGFP